MAQTWTQPLPQPSQPSQPSCSPPLPCSLDPQAYLLPRLHVPHRSKESWGEGPKDAREGKEEKGWGGFLAHFYHGDYTHTHTHPQTHSCAHRHTWTPKGVTGPPWGLQAQSPGTSSQVGLPTPQSSGSSHLPETLSLETHYPTAAGRSEMRSEKELLP